MNAVNRSYTYAAYAFCIPQSGALLSENAVRISCSDITERCANSKSLFDLVLCFFLPAEPVHRVGSRPGTSSIDWDRRYSKLGVVSWAAGHD